MSEIPREDAPATRADVGRLDGRMDGLDTRMDRLDGRMDRLDGRMDGLDKKIDGVEHRLGGRIDEVREDMRRVIVDQSKMHGMMHDMERRLGARMDQGFSKVLDAMTGFVSQVQTIDRRQVATSHRVDALEGRVDALEGPRAGP